MDGWNLQWPKCYSGGLSRNVSGGKSQGHRQKSVAPEQKRKTTPPTSDASRKCSDLTLSPYSVTLLLHFGQLLSSIAEWAMLDCLAILLDNPTDSDLISKKSLRTIYIPLIEY